MAAYKVTPPRAEQLARLTTLTGKQMQVAHLLAQGLTHADVGVVLDRHPKTIANHVSDMLEQTRVRNTNELMRLVIWREALAYLEKWTRRE